MQHDESIDYGNETPSNTVSPMFQRTKHEWQIEHLQSVVPTLLRPSNPVYSAGAYRIAGREIGALHGRDYGFGPLWFGRGECSQTSEIASVGVEGSK